MKIEDKITRKVETLGTVGVLLGMVSSAIVISLVIVGVNAIADVGLKTIAEIIWNGQNG